MCRRFSLAVALSVVLFVVAAASSASAQGGPDVFVTPIPNAPFSGVISVERWVVQPDGSVVKLKTLRDIRRDSRGRIYNEMRDLVPISSNKTPDVLGIHLYDPRTRISTRLDPQRHLFWTSTVNRPPATVPPALFHASPTGTNLPQNEFTKEEDLGVHEIEGVMAHGVRQTQSITSENGSPDKDTIITDEFWYADELRINLVIKHNDPRTGGVTMTVTQVSCTEPDPAFFEIPQGYKTASDESADSK